MPRGDKSKYTDKQKRQAEHIEESYEKKGVSEEEAESRPGQPSTNKTAAATKAVRDAKNLPMRAKTRPTAILRQPKAAEKRDRLPTVKIVRENKRKARLI